MIVIAQSELSDFVFFLRMKCKVQQLLQFAPPNATGEVFRAQSGEHLIFGCQTESGEIQISSDEFFEAQVSSLWRAFREG